MRMTDKNLCDSCINYECEFQSGIVRTKCAFYMPPTASTIDEDEKLFMKLVEDNYRLSTGTKLEGWQKSSLLQWYRFNKLYPYAKVIMGRKGPIVVMPKEGAEYGKID